MTNQPIAQANDDGYGAFILGIERKDNPHTERVLRRAWFEGYDQSESDHSVQIDYGC